MSKNKNSTEEEPIKIILLGNAGTGKTNLINVCCDYEFSDKIGSTITASYLEKIIEINNIKYSIKLWDTAGQEVYRSLNKLFIKGSKICVLVYDITKRESFEALSEWEKTLEGLIGKEAVIAVVGNKNDLYLKETVEESEEDEYAKIKGILHCRTSAKKDKVGFQNFIKKLVEEYLYKKKLNEWIFIEKDNEIFNLSKDAFQQNKNVKKPCC